MNRKLNLLFAASLSLAGLASADPTDTASFYGTLDVALGSQEFSPNTSALFPGSVNPVNKVALKYNSSVTGMFNGGISDSRWGFKGSKDLGNGMHAFFVLESGINVPTGEVNNAAGAIAGSSNTMAAASALSGQIFNRGAYLGIKQDMLGSLAFGRTPTMGLETVVNYDPLFAAQLFSPLGFSGSYSAGGITEGSRTDNNIKYTNKIGPVNVGLSTSLAGDTGSIGAGATYGANIGFEAYGFGIQAVYYKAVDALHSGANAGVNAVAVGTTAGLNVGGLSNNNDHDILLAAKYTLGSATVKGGFETYQLAPPSDTVVTGATVSYYGYSGTVTNTTAVTNANVYFIGGDYKFFPQFDVAAGFYDTQTLHTTKVKYGNQFQYSLLADYKLSHRTDAYLGTMMSYFEGNTFDGNHRSNYIYALGYRLIFG